MSRTDHHRRQPVAEREFPYTRNSTLTANRRLRSKQRRAMARGDYDALPTFQPTRLVRTHPDSE